MTNELKIVHRENVEAFDWLTLNADHRIDFEDDELTAVYPAAADETEYIVAVFPVSDGTVELPDGTAILEATDDVIALIPATAYGGDN